MLNQSHFEFAAYSYDDLRLYGQGWSAKSPLGLFLLVHDLKEDSSYYENLGLFLSKSGYALMVMDIRGHGKSDRLNNTEVAYSLLLHDIGKLVKKGQLQFGTIPIFLVGCGYGGNLVLNYAIRIKNDLNGVIAINPWLKLAKTIPDIQRSLEKPIKLSFPSLLEKEVLPNQQKIIYKEHLQSIISAGLFALEYGNTLSKPVFLLQGTKDQIFSPSANKVFASSNPEFIQTKLYTNYTHTLLQDRAWKNVANDIISWADSIANKTIKYNLLN